MKKVCIIPLLILCTALVTGCSSTTVQSSSISIESLPGDIAYDYRNTFISLSSVSFCEIYANHGYTGYCIVTVDRTNLSDDDVYWMLNKDFGDIRAEFEINAYLSSENNALDSDRMSKLQTVYDSENIYFMFYTGDVQREHLDDFKISLQMIMSPGKSLAAETTQYYSYRYSAEDDVDYSDYNSVLSENEINLLLDAINAEIDSLS